MSQHAGEGDWLPRWWRIQVGTESLLVGAVTVPLRMLAAPVGLADFDRQLRSLLQASVTEIPVLEAAS